MEYKDYYKILGVNKDASTDEIKKVYRKLAKKYHPDLNPGDEEAEKRFKEVSEAYEILGDEEKRKQYDTFGSAHNFRGGQNFDPRDFGYTYTTSGDMGGFSDFFDTFFGGGAHQTTGGFDFGDIFSGSSRRAQRRPEYNSRLSLSLKEAYEGAEKVVRLNLDGHTVNIDVKVPKGIKEGQKLRVKGEKWGLDGDVLFKMDIRKNSSEYLDGLDIIKKVEVYPWEAYFGGEKIIDPITGKIKVNVPKGARSGQRLRIRNRGFEDINGNRGHLFIEFEIINPKSLDKHQEDLYRQLQESFKN